VIIDKFVIGADLVFSRSRSNVTVAGNNDPEFPAATTSIDSVKLYANYKLNEKVTLSGSYWYEGYDAQDWHLDGVLPGTVPNLLAFGVQPPGYHVNVLRLAVRYRF
jgi:hypothetical protein